MANSRIYYASQAIYIKPVADGGAYEFVHGVQSADDSYDLPSEPVNQFGMVGAYEIADGIATVNFNCSKVLDGCLPIGLLASEGASSAGLTSRAEKSCVIAAAVYPSDLDYVSGNPTRVIEYSGLQMTNWSFEFNVDGPFTESMSFEGNYAEWALGGAAKYGTFPTNPTASGTEEPCALTACSGGVQFRENLRFTGVYPTLLPTIIPGVSASGTITYNGSCPSVPLQSVSVSVDLSREQVNQLGCKNAFARYPTYPVDVTTEISIFAQSGHNLEVTELGAYTVGCERTNAPSSRLRFSTDSGLIIDLGSKNKLTSVTQTFGDTGGTNGTYTLSFTNKSVMSVFHVNDPSSIAYSGTT